MSETATWKDRFCTALRILAPPDDPRKWNRGALAELRRGLGGETWRVLAHAGYVFSAVPDRAIDTAVLIAGLFAMHPQPGGRDTLGQSFAQIRDVSESIEKRFVALLDADKEDVSEHLRHAVSLLKAKEVSINWPRLLQDILDWDHPSRRTQQRWARDFWTEQPTEQPEPIFAAVPQNT
jgi:CRISPR system Cascade subunit CasB